MFILARPGELQPYAPNAVGFRDNNTALGSIGIGVGLYYLASRPEGFGGRDPVVKKAVVVSSKAIAVLSVHRGLRNFLSGNKAFFATIAGVVTAEWLLHKKSHALLPAVGWGYGNEWESVWDEHRSYLEPNFWERPGW